MEFGIARPDRKDDGVMIRVTHRYQRALQGNATRCFSDRSVHHRACRQVKLERMLAELRHGGRGLILQQIVLNDAKLIASWLGLDLHHVLAEHDAVNLRLGGEHVDIDRRCSWLDRFEVIGLIVSYAQHVQRARPIPGRHLDGEAATPIGFGPGQFLHALCQL